MQFAAAGGQFIPLDDALTVPRDRLPRHGHALGLASGAGGVNQVRQVPAQRFNRARQQRLITQLIKQQPRGGSREGHAFVHIAVAQQQAGRRVGQHERQPLGRVVEVQRQIRSTGLEHRHKRHNRLF